MPRFGRKPERKEPARYKPRKSIILKKGLMNTWFDVVG
jgi:hypothetical protein